MVRNLVRIIVLGVIRPIMTAFEGMVFCVRKKINWIEIGKNAVKVISAVDYSLKGLNKRGNMEDDFFCQLSLLHVVMHIM